MEIANSLSVKPATIKSYLTGSGVTILRSYCLNAQVAEAFGITEAELRGAGARWNGRYWVGRGPNQSEVCCGLTPDAALFCYGAVIPRNSSYPKVSALSLS